MLDYPWWLTWHSDLTCLPHKAFNPEVKGQAHYWQTHRPDRANTGGWVEPYIFFLFTRLGGRKEGVRFISKGIVPWEISVLIIRVSGSFKCRCSESVSDSLFLFWQQINDVDLLMLLEIHAEELLRNSPCVYDCMPVKNHCSNYNDLKEARI